MIICFLIFYGNYYGTSADFLDKGLADNRDILLDIDVQGTRQILERFPDSVAIFILPPSLAVLEQRLVARDTDSAENIAVRLQNAKKEMAQQDLYHHVIINDEISNAVSELISIIEHYHTQQ